MATTNASVVGAGVIKKMNKRDCFALLYSSGISRSPMPETRFWCGRSFLDIITRVRPARLFVGECISLERFFVRENSRTMVLEEFSLFFGSKRLREKHALGRSGLKVLEY